MRSSDHRPLASAIGRGSPLAARLADSSAVAFRSPQTQIILDCEPGVFENPHGETAPEVAGMDGNGDGDAPAFVPEGQVAAALPVLDEALRLEEPD